MPTSYLPLILPRTSTDVVMAGDVVDDAHAIQIFLGGYSRHSEHTIRAYEAETKRFNAAKGNNFSSFSSRLK